MIGKEEIGKLSSIFWQYYKRYCTHLVYKLYIDGKLNPYLNSKQQYNPNNLKSIKKLDINTKKFAENIFEQMEYQWSNYTCNNRKYLIAHKGYYNVRITVDFEPLDYFIYFSSVFILIDDIVESHVPQTYLMNTWDDTKYKEKIYTENEKLAFQSSLESQDEQDTYENPVFLYNIENFVKTYPFLRNVAQLNSPFFDSNNDGVIVSIDIANFYDTIPLSKLRSMLEDVSKKTDIINLLMNFLSSKDELLKEKKQVGIPQDILGVSGILAHFYMSKIDKHWSKELELINGKYIRFADEMVFFIPNKEKESELLSEISRSLALFNLNVNTSKTVRMYEKKDVDDYFLFNYFEKLNTNPSIGDTIQSTPNKINDIFHEINNIYINSTNSKKDSILKRISSVVTKFKECEDVFTDDNKSKFFELFESEDRHILQLNQFYIDSLYRLKNDSDKNEFLEFLNKIKSRYKVYTSFHSILEYAIYEINRAKNT